MREDGINLSKSTAREIGNKAKSIGIEYDEMKEFAEIEARKLFDEVFSKS